MTRLLSILLALLCLSTPARSQQAALPHNPNTGEVPGDLVFTGNNTFEQSVTLGTVSPVAPADGIVTITVNGTASAVAGQSIFLPDGNSVELFFLDPDYKWANSRVEGNSFSETTAADVAYALRSWLSDYYSSYLTPAPSVGGTGADVIITYYEAPAESWSSSSGTVLPVANTQNGSAGGWSGTPKFLRLFNADNNKLYELKITGSPNPVLTISEVAP